MTQPQPPGAQQPTITSEQVADAAAAGLELLSGEIAMTGAMRRRIGLLELLLQQLAQGSAVLVNPQQPQVELPEETPEDKKPTPKRRRAKPKAVK